jgi:general secretion pathway protein J
VSRSRIEGFSLLEAVAAVALTSTIVLALSSITGLWLPNWRRGFEILQRSDLVELGLERIAEDLSVAEFVTPWADAPGPLFEGDPASVTFVRSAIGPNARPELEVVHIAEASDSRGPAFVRTRSRFTPVEPGRPAGPSGSTDPVALIRAPLQVRFAYAGPEHVWAQRWKNEERLPEAIRVTIVDASSRAQVASTVVRLKITAPGVPKRNPQANAADATPPATGQAPVSATLGKQ